MKLLLAQTEHIADIMDIIEDGRQTLRELGIPQWQQSYPTQQTIVADIVAGNSYLLLKQNQLIGTVALLTTEEATYNHLKNGKWHSTRPYLTIHRLALAKSFLNKGIGSIFLKKIEEIALTKDRYSIRLDTHENNKPMRQLALKNGYQFAGKVNYGDIFDCFAYDKILGEPR